MSPETCGLGTPNQHSCLAGRTRCGDATPRKGRGAQRPPAEHQLTPSSAAQRLPPSSKTHCEPARCARPREVAWRVSVQTRCGKYRECREPTSIVDGVNSLVAQSRRTVQGSCFMLTPLCRCRSSHLQGSRSTTPEIRRCHTPQHEAQISMLQRPRRVRPLLPLLGRAVCVGKSRHSRLQHPRSPSPNPTPVRELQTPLGHKSDAHGNDNVVLRDAPSMQQLTETSSADSKARRHCCSKNLQTTKSRPRRRPRDPAM